ncbi:M48 family metallopeptidase [Nocardioides sp. Root151]|uniref:M48 family metallopeptidase n=1 Tax=Nocardioides sp. Root151 TaxID=1736475 RepID=UPI000B069AA5|nr:M48 family metallopeptidase [Nocardioides sp. Root151]
MIAGEQRTGLVTRRQLWVLTLGGALLFVLVAAVLVPWQPVPGGAPDPVPATDVLTRAQLERGEEFARLSRILSWSSLAVSLVVSCVLGFTRLGTRLLGRRSWPWPVTVVGLTAAVLVIGRLATLPFAVALRDHRVDYGLTTQGLGGWALDQVKGLGLAIVFTSIALLVLFGCVRRWRTWWPAVVAGIYVVLLLGGSFLYPVVVEPVFNDFSSMPDGPMRQEILALADQEGVAVDDVLVADASRRTTTLNAYVSGFGGTRRVVVYDNLVDHQPDEQVLSVVAHELAHAKHDDVLVGTALGAFGALVGVGLLGLIMGRPGLRRRAGVEGLADPRAVATVLALLALATFFVSPVENTISRRIEMRADVDALAVTPASAMVDLQRELCLGAVCDPTPPAWSQFWFGSHPTALERVAVARKIGEK